MQTKNILIILLASLILSMGASALSTTFGSNTYTVNASVHDYGASNLGTMYKYTVNQISWVDSSQNDTGCHEAWMIATSGDGVTYTNGTWSDTGYLLTATNSTGTGGTQALGLSNIQYLKVYGNATINETLGSTHLCYITGVSIGFDGALSDTLGGLPSMGGDLSLFMLAIAPGIGMFVLIMAVFTAVGGILFAVVLLIKRKVSGGGEGKV